MIINKHNLSFRPRNEETFHTSRRSNEARGSLPLLLRTKRRGSPLRRGALRRSTWSFTAAEFTMSGAIRAREPKRVRPAPRAAAAAPALASLLIKARLLEWIEKAPGRRCLGLPRVGRAATPPRSGSRFRSGPDRPRPAVGLTLTRTGGPGLRSTLFDQHPGIIR